MAIDDDVDDWPESPEPMRGWGVESGAWSLDEPDWPDEDDLTPGRHRFSRRRRLASSDDVDPDPSDDHPPRIIRRAKRLAVVALVLMSALFVWRISTDTTSPEKFAGDPSAGGPVSIPDLFTLEPLPSDTLAGSEVSPSATAPAPSTSAGQASTPPSAPSTTTTHRVVVTNPGDQRGTAGVPQTLQLRASTSVTGLSMVYAATGLPAGMALSAGSGQVSGTPSAAGVTQVLVTATDNAGVSGTATFTWTIVTLPPSCSSGQRLNNPGFESGATAWRASGDVVDHSNEFPPRSGSWKAWLGGYSDTHTDTLSQSVSLPSSCSTVTLGFWLHIDTDETGNRTYDTLRIDILSGSGSRLATLATYSNADDNNGYVQRTFDLSRYQGQVIQVSFTAQTDYSRATSFLVDDVGVKVA